MRRRFKLNSNNNPLSTAGRDIARNRGVDKPSDMRKAKRARFDDTEIDGVPVRASFSGRDAAESPRCAVPKTSEYTYFMKMKNGSVGGHSRALREENGQLESPKINDFFRVTSNVPDKLEPSSRDLNVSITVERAGPCDHTILSPLSQHDESDEIRKLTCKVEKRSSLLSENVTPIGQSLFLSPLIETPEISENQFSEKGIFAAKRVKLCQWVADTSFPEVEKHHPKGSDMHSLHPKGFDFVSLLLSRLLPKGNENNGSSDGDTNKSTKSLTCHKSNNLEEGLPLSHRKALDKDLPEIGSDGSICIVLAELDSFNSGFPSNYHKESHLQGESIHPDQRPNSHMYRNPHMQCGFPFCSPYESFRYSGSSRFKNLDEFDSTIQCRRQPCSLFLEWDSEFEKDTLKSSIDNHDTEKYVCSRLANSWNLDQ